MQTRSAPPDAFPTVESDPLDAVRRAAATAVPFAPLAGMLSRQAMIGYYALPRRLAPHVPPGSRAFTVHEKSGIAALFFGMAFVALVEAGAAHVVLHRWTAAGAWMTTALSVYGAVWLVAMARALALRPALVDAGGVTLRAGLLRTVRLEATDIVEVRAPRRRPARREPHYVSFALFGAPTVIIKLKRPVDVGGLFGTTPGVTHIGLAPDDVTSFLACFTDRHA